MLWPKSLFSSGYMLDGTLSLVLGALQVALKRLYLSHTEFKVVKPVSIWMVLTLVEALTPIA